MKQDVLQAIFSTDMPNYNASSSTGWYLHNMNISEYNTKVCVAALFLWMVMFVAYILRMERNRGERLPRLRETESRTELYPIMREKMCTLTDISKYWFTCALDSYYLLLLIFVVFCTVSFFLSVCGRGAFVTYLRWLVVFDTVLWLCHGNTYLR